MKKSLLSLGIGLIIGVFLSLFAIENQGQTVYSLYKYGELNTQFHLLNLPFISESIIVILGVVFFIYICWTHMEKKLK